MALAIDGATFNFASSASSVSSGLTTSNTNDVIIVVATSVATPGAAPTVSSVTGGGLSWNKRAASGSTAIGGGTNGNLEVWYAIAAAKLTSTNITATFTGSANTVEIVLFGVSGANTTTPWDANVSIPKFASSTIGSTPSVNSVSTSNANDMALGFFATNSTPVSTPGSGYTIILNGVETGTEEKVVSTTQSSVSVAFGASNPTGWVMYADAIQAASFVPYIQPDDNTADIARARRMYRRVPM